MTTLKSDMAKYNKLELQTISNGNGVSPSNVPLTPTIRLSEPSTPKHSRNSVTPFAVGQGVGYTNPAFIGDEEPVFSKSFKGEDTNDGDNTSQFLAENKADSVSVFSASIEQNGFLQSSTDSNHSGNGEIHGMQRNRNNTMSLTDMLMPPGYVNSAGSKRHSLPNPDQLSSSTQSNLRHSITTSNGSISILNGSSCGSSVSSPRKSFSSWKKWFRRKNSEASMVSSVSDCSIFSANGLDVEERSNASKQRLQTWVKMVANKVGKQNKVAPLQSSSESKDLSGKESKTPVPVTEKNKDSLAPPPNPHAPTQVTRTRKRLDSFAPSSTGDQAELLHLRGFKFDKMNWRNIIPDFFDPSGTLWLCWLFVISCAFIYNAFVIFLRGTFPEYQNGNWLYFWLLLDYFCDILYILDMVYFRTHLSFFLGGQLVTDKKVMRKKYLISKKFKYDLLCLLPLDLIYLRVGVVQPLFRLPRLLKFHNYTEFSQKLENKLRRAYIFRIVRMVGLLLYMIHLNTCCYYAISKFEGIGSNEWVYEGEGIAYVRCMYRATKTLITIGNLPPPETNAEIVFMTVDFMLGIFVFASIIGQMRDIVGGVSATRMNFHRRMDTTLSILKSWNIPKKVQSRVRLWFMYAIDRGEMLDEREVLGAVPIKMQTDLAIHVHMDTLSKVSLFQDCDKMLLRDLVLQLRPVLFLPGDYICKKGEVGKEMYIIKNGIVQVLAGTKVLATLSAGSVFGEISLLNLGSGNRRTADVFSPGYADLFVLDKSVLQDVVAHYPDAQENLKKKAKEMLRQNEANKTPKKKRRGKSLIAESILKRNFSKNSSRFFNAVLEAARTQRISATILKGSFEKRSPLIAEKDEFVHYSSSDFSEDEEMKVKRKHLKRKKGNQGEVKNSSFVSNIESGSDGFRSDAEGVEPSIVIHPMPKGVLVPKFYIGDVESTNMETSSDVKSPAVLEVDQDGADNGSSVDGVVPMEDDGTCVDNPYPEIGTQTNQGKESLPHEGIHNQEKDPMEAVGTDANVVSKDAEITKDVEEGHVAAIEHSTNSMVSQTNPSDGIETLEDSKEIVDFYERKHPGPEEAPLIPSLVKPPTLIFSEVKDEPESEADGDENNLEDEHDPQSADHVKKEDAAESEDVVDEMGQGAMARKAESSDNSDSSDDEDSCDTEEEKDLTPDEQEATDQQDYPKDEVPLPDDNSSCQEPTPMVQPPRLVKRNESFESGDHDFRNDTPMTDITTTERISRPDLINARNVAWIEDEKSGQDSPVMKARGRSAKKKDDKKKREEKLQFTQEETQAEQNLEMSESNPDTSGTKPRRKRSPKKKKVPTATLR